MWRALETEPRQILNGHEEGNLGNKPRTSLRAAAPALDPTRMRVRRHRPRCEPPIRYWLIPQEPWSWRTSKLAWPNWSVRWRHRNRTAIAKKMRTQLHSRLRVLQDRLRPAQIKPAKTPIPTWFREELEKQGIRFDESGRPELNSLPTADVA